MIGALLSATILANATSGWFGFSTAQEESTFWVRQLMGDSGASDYKDGDVVEKGGAAQRVRAKYATSQTALASARAIRCAAAQRATRAKGSAGLVFSKRSSSLQSEGSSAAGRAATPPTIRP